MFVFAEGVIERS